MGIEKLTERIIKEAEAEREKIKKEYEEKIARLKLEIEEEKEKLRQKEKEALAKEITKERKRILAEKRIEQKKEILRHQWTMIKRIEQLVKERFRQEIGNYYELIKEIGKKFTQPDNTLFFSPKDLPSVKDQFPNAKSNEKLSDGIIIENEKGRKEIHISLEAALEVLKEEILLEFKKYF